MLKAYVGGSYSGRKRVMAEAQRLEDLGLHVICNWFDDAYFLEQQWDGDFGGDVADAMARIDESQIRDADLVVIDSIDKSSTGGSDSELGIARGLGKTIIHIGPYRNIFQKLATEHYANWDLFITLLEMRKQ